VGDEVHHGMTVNLPSNISIESSMSDSAGHPLVTKESAAYLPQQSMIAHASLPQTEGLVTLDEDGNQLYWDGREWKELEGEEEKDESFGSARRPGGGFYDA
jgi:hypothetical protein